MGRTYTRVQRAAALNGALKRQTRAIPIIVKGIGRPTLTTLSPKAMADLRIDDERYQRVRDVQEVNSLIHTIRGGGSIPDPITVSRRPDGTMWIVDGQQRFWAHFETETAISALLYDVPDIETERMLFVVMNTQRVVGTAVRIHAWPGPVAAYLRAQNDAVDSPLFCQVDFGKHHGRAFSAGPLLRAMLVAMTGLGSQGMGTNDLLRRSDVAWNAETAARDRARGFLPLAVAVLGRDGGAVGHAGRLPLLALASVAHDRWQRTVRQPDDTIIRALRRINWSTLVPSNAGRFMPVLKAAVEAKWKA